MDRSSEPTLLKISQTNTKAPDDLVLYGRDQSCSNPCSISSFIKKLILLHAKIVLGSFLECVVNVCFINIVR